MLLSSKCVKLGGLASRYLFLVLVPVHGPAFKEGPGSHVGRHCFLERLIDIARRCLVLTDALEPFPHVKMSCVVPFSVDVSVKQSALGKVELSG